MNQNDSSSNRNLNSTKSPIRPSHEAVESHTGDAQTSEDEKLDRVAMEGAKRAQNRIHNDEETTPGNTIFSK